MKSATCTLGVSWIFAAMTLQAQGPRADPVAEHLFPPDLVLQLRSEIGLTDEQRDTFRAEMEKAQPRFEAFNQQHQKETGELAELLKKERVDEKAALAQFDKVQKLEGEIRRAHLALVIAIKNKLTPGQQAKLEELKRKFAPSPPPAAIVSRAERIKAGVEEWQSEGGDSSTPKARATSAKNPEALRAEVQSLIATSDVPWRQITWESCLLEGLKRSREARKPLLLWVFIDRPADDRRC